MKHRLRTYKNTAGNTKKYSDRKACLPVFPFGFAEKLRFPPYPLLRAHL